MAVTLNADPIMSVNEAQAILDLKDTDELTRLVNGLSAKARAHMGRTQLVQNLTTPAVENLRTWATPTLYLHAPAEVSDFDTYEVKVEVYSLGQVATTYLASEDEIIVTSDDFSTRVDLASGCFPDAQGGDFIRVTYYAGWATVPSDVLDGAIMQARVDIKRRTGEVGYQSHSLDGESIQLDQGGVIKEARSLWAPYKVLV